MKKFKVILYWVLVSLLAVLFVSSGYSKITGGASMIQRFEAWGYGVSFMRLIGLLELVGGLLLLLPRLVHYASSLLSIIMIGATYTHLSSGIGGPEFAIGVLVVLLFILARKRNNFRKLFQRNS